MARRKAEFGPLATLRSETCEPAAGVPTTWSCQKAAKRNDLCFAAASIRCISVVMTGLIFGFCGVCRAAEQDTDDAAYEALLNFATIASMEATKTSCSVAAVADFDAYTPHLVTFREKWLNKDYSVDFYNQGRKQVFVYTILKRYAELITEGLYQNHKEQIAESCSFKIDVKAFDKYGKIQFYPAITWAFTLSLAKSIAWENFDPRNFQEVAINYKLSPEMSDWLSDEPDMAANKGASDKNMLSCDPKYLKANATFIRATVHCKRDYMDTPAGFYALAMSRQCAAMPEAELRAIAKAAMVELDDIAKRKGKAAACKWVDDLEKEIVRDVVK